MSFSPSSSNSSSNNNGKAKAEDNDNDKAKATPTVHSPPAKRPEVDVESANFLLIASQNDPTAASPDPSPAPQASVSYLQFMKEIELKLAAQGAKLEAQDAAHETKIEELRSELKAQGTKIEEQCSELKAQGTKIEEQRPELKAQRTKIEEQRSELQALRDELTKLTQRLDSIINAFIPMTRHALCETAIYEFIISVIPTGSEKYQENIRHSVTTLCIEVMELLLFTETSGRVQKKLQWHGPSTNKAKRGTFPKEAIRPIVVRALTGLAAYLKPDKDFVDHHNLKKWEPAGRRNKLAHDGEFLDALFSSPSKKSSKVKNETTETVRACRNLFKSQAAKESAFESIDDAVNDLVKQITDSGGEVQVGQVQEVIKQLTRIASFDK